MAGIVKVSKNQRRGQRGEEFFCGCGGKIIMRTVVANGKKRLVARCMGCDLEKRRPTDFRK